MIEGLAVTRPDFFLTCRVPRSSSDALGPESYIMNASIHQQACSCIGRQKIAPFRANFPQLVPRRFASLTSTSPIIADEPEGPEGRGAHSQSPPELVSAVTSPSSSIKGSMEEESSSNQTAPKKKGGGLVKRVAFGLLMGAAGLGAVLVKQWLLAMCILVTYQATVEYYQMVTSKGITRGMAAPPALVSSLTMLVAVTMPVVSYFWMGRSSILLAVAAFFLLVMNLVAIGKPKFSMLASTLFGVFYCGWLPSFWIKLRLLSMPAPDIPILPELLAPLTSWTVGLVATFASALCVVAADVGAYVIGKTMGKTKLTEISPKKTVEGALGGLASSILVSLAVWKVFLWPASPFAAAVLGALTFFASLVGDLIESIIKRDAEMKDSGDLIPGHGGLLDRFDSYMFTGAVNFFYIIFVLPYITI